MKRLGLLLVLLLLCAGAATGLAGDKVELRLVQATNDNTGVPPGLADVADLLKQNMPFTGYRLADVQSVPLPANGNTDMRFGFSVQCSGAQNNLAVTVMQRGKELLRTATALEDGKPLILGGFLGGKCRIFLILLVR